MDGAGRDYPEVVYSVEFCESDKHTQEGDKEETDK